jgi:small subunit ribosomal protein S20
MPNKQSAKKALRQGKKRAYRNLVVKRAYKDALKTADKAIETKEKNAAELIRTAQKTLDKAAKRGVIKKNTASRKLSRITKRMQKATK